MKIIIASRGMGKTTQLIAESAAQGYYIICKNREAVERIWRQAQLEGKKEMPFPLTYSEFLEGQYYGKRIRGFLIDDAECLLQSLTPVPIQTITITPE